MFCCVAFRPWPLLDPRTKSDAQQIDQISENSRYDGRPCVVITTPQYGDLSDLVAQSAGEVKHLHVEHKSVHDQS